MVQLEAFVVFAMSLNLNVGVGAGLSSLFTS